MNAVNGICGNIYGTLESKSHVCSKDIVVNRLRKMNDVQAFLSQKIGCFLGSVSSQDYQTVQAELIVSLLHGFHLVQSLFIRHTH